ncbi:hypothetical protein KI387_001808, partial [Taxus chinensis]
CFTMDEKRSKAVTEAFVQLYQQDLIYSPYQGGDPLQQFVRQLVDVLPPATFIQSVINQGDQRVSFGLVG